MNPRSVRTLQDLVILRGAVQELHPDLVHVAIEGYADEIAPEQRSDEAFYRQFSCPSCRSPNMVKEFVGGARACGVTWVADRVTPQALLRCQECSLLLNPRSGMIVDTGTHAPTL